MTAEKSVENSRRGFGRFDRFDKLTAGKLTAGDPALQKRRS